jgi:hypothetical protein
VPIDRHNIEDHPNPKKERIDAYVTWSEEGTIAMPVFDSLHYAPDI